MKYTDMCIWCDALIKRGNPTQEELDTAFQYLYHLAFMLAHKHKYFNESHYYEDFAIFLATEMLNRMFFNPKLNMVDENGEPLMKPIKSVLNYMKALLYGRKCVFEAQNYSQKIQNIVTEFDSNYNIGARLAQGSSNELSPCVDIYLETISKEVKNIVYKTCVNIAQNDPVVLKNIYVSCLLSIINGMTYSATDLENIRMTYTIPESKYAYASRIYNNNKENCVVLYNLDKSWHDYIKLTVRRIFKKMRDDIVELGRTNFNVSEDVLSELVYLELDGAGIVVD